MTDRKPTYLRLGNPNIVHLIFGSATITHALTKQDVTVYRTCCGLNKEETSLVKTYSELPEGASVCKRCAPEKYRRLEN